LLTNEAALQVWPAHYFSRRKAYKQTSSALRNRARDIQLRAVVAFKYAVLSVPTRKKPPMHSNAFLWLIMAEFDRTIDIDVARMLFLPVDAAILREVCSQIEVTI